MFAYAVPARIAHDLGKRAWLDALPVRPDDVGRRDVVLNGARDIRAGSGMTAAPAEEERDAAGDSSLSEVDVREERRAAFEPLVREDVVEPRGLHEPRPKLTGACRRNGGRLLIAI
jgi:hypothetical protein